MPVLKNETNNYEQNTTNRDNRSHKYVCYSKSDALKASNEFAYGGSQGGVHPYDHRASFHNIPYNNGHMHPYVRGINTLTDRMLPETVRQLQICTLKNEKLEDVLAENKRLAVITKEQEGKLRKYVKNESDFTRIISKNNEEIQAAREQLFQEKNKCCSTELRLQDTFNELINTEHLLQKARQSCGSKRLDSFEHIHRKLTQMADIHYVKQKCIHELEKRIENLNKTHKHELYIERQRQHEVLHDSAELKEKLSFVQHNLEDVRRELCITNIYANRALKGQKKFKDNVTASTNKRASLKIQNEKYDKCSNKVNITHEKPEAKVTNVKLQPRVQSKVKKQMSSASYMPGWLRPEEKHTPHFFKEVMKPSPKSTKKIQKQSVQKDESREANSQKASSKEDCESHTHEYTTHGLNTNKRTKTLLSKMKVLENSHEAANVILNDSFELTTPTRKDFADDEDVPEGKHKSEHSSYEPSFASPNSQSNQLFNISTAESNENLLNNLFGENIETNNKHEGNIFQELKTSYTNISARRCPGGEIQDYLSGKQPSKSSSTLMPCTVMPAISTSVSTP